MPELRLLIRAGFQSVDAKTWATLASLHLHGVFAAGATLIGSHAFGVLINQMGIRAVAYATEDIDVARRETLAFEQIPETNFLEMLREGGIHSHIDLLVPSPDSEIQIIAVSELKAHATALPYLSYVLGQTQTATLITREGCCPVRVPVAERFAIHKLLVSQLRTNRDAKSEKDIFQASVLLAALADRYPGAIESAVIDTPISARKYLISASSCALNLLQAHPRASEELTDSIAQLSR